MSKVKFYYSVYPGGMSESEDGDYVDRTDSVSLSGAILQNIRKLETEVEDWKAASIQLEKELAEMTRERDELAAKLAPNSNESFVELFRRHKKLRRNYENN